MIRRPPRSTLFPTRRSSDLGWIGGRSTPAVDRYLAGYVTGATAADPTVSAAVRSEEHTSELQSHHDLVCRLLLEKKKTELRENVKHVPNATESTIARKSEMT